MDRQRALSEVDKGVSPSPILAVQSGEDRGIEELSRKMLSWSSLWFGASGNCEPTEEHMVRQRLLSWLERCIGLQVGGVLTSRVEDVSLATSTPLLTAFLGRRAMREVSRRVLSDL